MCDPHSHIRSQPHTVSHPQTTTATIHKPTQTCTTIRSHVSTPRKFAAPSKSAHWILFRQRQACVRVPTRLVPMSRGFFSESETVGHGTCASLTLRSCLEQYKISWKEEVSQERDNRGKSYDDFFTCDKFFCAWIFQLSSPARARGSDWLLRGLDPPQAPTIQSHGARGNDVCPTAQIVL